MDKRVFQIDEKCFIIYTGKSSADNRSFLRIGNSQFLNDKKDIQSHIRHIVISDALSVDMQKEKDNIKYMEKGKIIYICNKKNQDILFNNLQKVGVDTNSLYHRDLSKELENVNRLENKKHFFTIFYENKNVKLVFNEEVFFDLFSYKKESDSFDKERLRLSNFIAMLDNLNKESKELSFTEECLKEKEDDLLDLDRSSMFIAQDNHYFPLNVGMFKMVNYSDDENSNENTVNNILFKFNCSSRFYAGRYLSLIVLERDKNKIELSDILLESDVLESQILYGYSMIFKNNSLKERCNVLKLYKHLIDGINKSGINKK